MVIEKNVVITGSFGRPMATDIFYVADGQAKPVAIYAHGFNGFKDWANFDLIAKQFATAGFVFIKLNFSHNGTSMEHTEDFVDLDAYAENNYTKELYDLQMVIDWALDKSNKHAAAIDTKHLMLIGHSRGGGIVILKAAEEKNIKAIATWASVSECKTPWGKWDEEKMNEWKATGVQYTLNSRTKQQMPLHYQLYEDYVQHADKLDIIKAISGLTIPVLICHGTEDEGVPIAHAFTLNEANPTAELFTVASDHVFGRKHPWLEGSLPAPMQEVVKGTIEFLR